MFHFVLRFLGFPPPTENKCSWIEEDAVVAGGVGGPRRAAPAALLVTTTADDPNVPLSGQTT